jgi:hypothetical protein
MTRTQQLLVCVRAWRGFAQESRRNDPAAYTAEGILSPGTVAGGVVREALACEAADAQVYETTGAPLGEVAPSIAAERSVRLRLTYPPELFHRNVESLTAQERPRLCAPPDFYIVEGDYLRSDGQPPPDAVRDYLAAVGIWGVLCAVADHSTPADGPDRLVFFTQPKIVVAGSYAFDSIRGLARKAGSLDMLQLVSATPHGAEAKQIVKACLAKYLERTPETERLDALMGRWEQFVQSVEADYALFVSGFSMEQLKDEVQETASAMMARMSAALGSVETKLLAMPVSLAIVGSQMRPERAAWPGNLAVLAGVTMVFVFFVMALRVCHDDLAVAIGETRAMRKRLCDKAPMAVAVSASSGFGQVEARYSRDVRMLAVVAVVGVVCLVWTVVLYANADGPMIDFLVGGILQHVYGIQGQ